MGVEPNGMPSGHMTLKIRLSLLLWYSSPSHEVDGRARPSSPHNDMVPALLIGLKEVEQMNSGQKPPNY